MYSAEVYEVNGCIMGKEKLFLGNSGKFLAEYALKVCGLTGLLYSGPRSPFGGFSRIVQVRRRV